MPHIDIDIQGERLLRRVAVGRVPSTSPFLPLWDRTWWGSLPDQCLKQKNPVPELLSRRPNS